MSGVPLTSGVPIVTMIQHGVRSATRPRRSVLAAEILMMSDGQDTPKTWAELLDCSQDGREFGAVLTGLLAALDQMRNE